ncbi:MAG: multidrug ABC transporter ATP-binding protein, partial [Actinomycetales bacterium]
MTKTPAPVKANARPKYGPADNRPRIGAGTGEKAISFFPSLKRLLKYLHPARFLIAFAVTLGTIGVALNVIGPKILGAATDKLLAGIIGARFPAGANREQIIEKLRAENPNLADMVSGVDFIPGVGIDFTAMGQILGLALVLFVIAGLFTYAQGWILNEVIQ